MPKRVIKLTQKMIDIIFEKAEKQEDYIVALYKIAFPRWDDIVKIHGYPNINGPTNKYIFGKAIAFDKEYHPDIFAGGAWMNNGFSSQNNEDMKGWTIDISECKVEYNVSDL